MSTLRNSSKDKASSSLDHAADIDAVIQRVQNGDIDAFKSLVRLFEWPVRSWVTMRSPPGADIDDVAQRTFIEAFRNIGRYKPNSDFKSWLLTIARYQVMAECTRLRRLADYHERYVPHALALEFERRLVETLPQPEHRLELLKQCVATLTATSQELLRLRYDGDQSLEQVAQTVGRSLGAIKKHFFLIRQQLHECVRAKQQTEP